MLSKVWPPVGCKSQVLVGEFIGESTEPLSQELLDYGFGLNAGESKREATRRTRKLPGKFHDCRR